MCFQNRGWVALDFFSVLFKESGRTKITFRRINKEEDAEEGDSFGGGGGGWGETK